MFERVRHRQTFSESSGTSWPAAAPVDDRQKCECVLLPNDIISHRPTLFGMYEPHIEALITKRPRRGDFLLDIGANIGMTSALVGRWFMSTASSRTSGW